MNYKCTPVSKNKLKNLAVEFRRNFGVKELVFPVLDIIEELHGNGIINFLIIDDSDSKLEVNQIALYEVDTNTMYVKLSVYEEALQDIARSRFTLTHELAHYILLHLLKFEIIPTFEEIKAYEDPEWQANYLASELLAPSEDTLHFTVTDYMNKCVVSEECAIVLWDKRRKTDKIDLIKSY